MLIIISDLHLSDGTCAQSVAAQAFNLFGERIQELAYNASWDDHGTYRPIESIDLVLLGDVLDPLNSTLWLDTPLNSPGTARPWSDPNQPGYAAKLGQITRAIIDENKDGLETLRALSRREIVKLPPASNGHPDLGTKQRVSPLVGIHYMIGNHDWYYHLPGPAFDAIRADMVSRLGLSNPPGPFPWKLDESEPLSDLFGLYRVYAQHGDMYDNFNFDRTKGRDAATLGDVFAVEVVNRFPLEVDKELGDELSPAFRESLRKLPNIRPSLATPVWISGQIKQHVGSQALQNKLKKIWDQLSDQFLQVDFVRQADKAFQFDLVDALEVVVKISQKTSFDTVSDLAIWVREKMWSGELSYASHAMVEPALLNGQARYIVYGHTHHYEIVSLDLVARGTSFESQMYFNSGTWHSYYDMAVKNPREQKFIPYLAMTYLTFYQEKERGQRNFEAWSGAFA